MAAATHGPVPGARPHPFGQGRRRFRAWMVADRPDAAPAEPVFVLVHGLGVSSSLYGAVAERLRGQGRVIVFDLPGFGGVPQPRRPLSIGEFARGVTQAIDELGVTSPVLVGHSMGAQIVVEVARMRPDLAGRLVLVAPVVDDGQRSLTRLGAAFVASSVHEDPAAAWASVRGYLVAGLRWPLEVLPALVRYPIGDAIAGLGGRIAIVRGSADRLCPPAWADRLLAASGATGRVVVAEGAAHQVVVDHADVVARAVLAVAEAGPWP